MQEHEYEWRINKIFLFHINMQQRKTSILSKVGEIKAVACFLL